MCGNEVVAYPPLQGEPRCSQPYLDHEFKGKGLNANWDDPNCRGFLSAVSRSKNPARFATLRLTTLISIARSTSEDGIQSLPGASV